MWCVKMDKKDITEFEEALADIEDGLREVMRRRVKASIITTERDENDCLTMTVNLPELDKLVREISSFNPDALLKVSKEDAEDACMDIIIKESIKRYIK